MAFSSPQETMQRLALTVKSPGQDGAYQNDSFSFIARQIRENPYRFNEFDEIVLLGQGQQVGHIIIVRGQEILYDRQRALHLPSLFDRDAGEYTTKLASQASNYMKLNVVGRFNISQFKIDNGLEQPPAPPAILDIDS